MEIAELKARIAEELGPDAWNVYGKDDDGKHFIGEALLLALAASCIADFLKGFVDFNGLGKEAREKLEDLLGRFASKKRLDQYSDSGEIEELFIAAKLSIKHRRPSTLIAQREEALSIALQELGMHDRVARRHAKEIASTIVKALSE